VIFDTDQEETDFLKLFKELVGENQGFRISEYDGFVELKLSESMLHGTAGSELAQLLETSIHQTYYIPGTSSYDTGLVSAGTAGKFLNLA